jgi:hypothetical protein
MIKNTSISCPANAALTQPCSRSFLDLQANPAGFATTSGQARDFQTVAALRRLGL